MSVDDATKAIEKLNGNRTPGGATINLTYAKPPKIRQSEPAVKGKRAGYGGDW